MKRWILRIFTGLLAVVCLALVVVYVASNRTINKVHAFQPYPLTAATDSASLARGEHLARLGCFGCHGDSLKGQTLFDQPMIARLVAPNVPAKIAPLTDAEFAGFFRSGVRKDGTSPFVMPPPGYYHMSDADLSALLGFLRSLPRYPDTLPANSYRPMGRFGVMIGQFRTSVHEIDTTQERVGADPAWATTRQGEYLARMICSECHGVRLTGDSAAAGGATGTPSLSGALGYSQEEFLTLLRTGTPRVATTKLDLMADVARGALHHFSDQEIAAIYGYIRALPATGVRLEPRVSSP